MPILKSTPPQANQSRRNFIKNVGIAAAAFTIVPRFVLGGDGFTAPSDTLYIAGIGVGGKGTSDLTGFAANKKAKIVGQILTQAKLPGPIGTPAVTRVASRTIKQAMASQIVAFKAAAVLNWKRRAMPPILPRMKNPATKALVD